MLDIHGLSVTFSKGTVNERKALDGLDINLASGDFVTVLGSNGSGKSTLFNAICGSVFADAGRILLDKQDITYMLEHKRAAQIGRLFQDPLMGTAPEMTIEENLALAYARKTKHPLGLAVGKEDRKLFREELAKFGMGLEDRMKTRVGLLSGGQRQAMTLLMATTAKPKLLLLDEHTAALDPATAERVLEITVKTAKERNLTTMMITHNMHSALQVGNRTIMMDAGQIILDISGEERKTMTVEKLLSLYSLKRGEALDNDRMLLS